MNCPNCGMPSRKMDCSGSHEFSCGADAYEGCSETYTTTSACREIARLKAEVAQKDAEIAELKLLCRNIVVEIEPIVLPTTAEQNYPYSHASDIKPLTREDVKQREASRRRTLDIVLRDEDNNKTGEDK